MKRNLLPPHGQAFYILAVLAVFGVMVIAKLVQPAIEIGQLGGGVIITGLFALMSAAPPAPPPPGPGAAPIAPAAAPTPPVHAAPADGLTPAQRQAQANG